MRFHESVQHHDEGANSSSHLHEGHGCALFINVFRKCRLSICNTVLNIYARNQNEAFILWDKRYKYFRVYRLTESVNSMNVR